MRPSEEERRLHQKNILEYLNQEGINSSKICKRGNVSKKVWSHYPSGCFVASSSGQLLTIDEWDELLIKFRDRKGAKRHCNRVLQSNGKTYPVHESILGAASDYFRTMFDVEMREKYDDVVPVDKIPQKRLENILDYAYSGDINVTEENVMEVLEDAEYTQMEDLKEFCNTCILQIVSVDNCLKLRAYAHRYNLDDVLAKTNQTIADNFTTVLKQDDFMQLNLSDMSAIIGHRPKESEEAVFTGIMQWVNHNPVQREESFVNLFSKLDLSSMSSEFLSQVYAENMVKNNLVCSNMLVEAFMKLKKPACVDKGAEFLLIGGESSEQDCVVYNVITKQSRHLPNLNQKRSWMTSQKVGSKVYVIGGTPGQHLNPYKSCEMLDFKEQTRWVAMPDMLEAHSGCGSELVGDHIYVTGGFKGEKLASCERFDIHNNQWLSISNMLHPRTSHGTVMCRDSLYCIGGWNGKKQLSSCERYDLRSEKWHEIAPLKHARWGLACVVLWGEIYAIGGFNYGSMSTVEKYDTNMNRWKMVAPLPHARHDLTACVVQNKIFVIGGRGQSSVEIYDPTTDVWNHCFDLEKPIVGATAVAV